MAIAITAIEQVKIDTGGSVATASVDPAANELWVVDIAMRATGITPSVSGTGLTWASEGDVTNAQTQLRIFRFRGLSTSDPSSGVITVTVTGNTNPVNIHVWKATGVNTSGTDGSGAFRQTVNDPGPASVDDANMLKSITTGNNNAVCVAFGSYRAGVFSLPSGETAVGTLNQTSGAGGAVTTSSAWYESVPTAGTVTLGATGDLNSARDWAILVSELVPGSNSYDVSFALDRQVQVADDRVAGKSASVTLARTESAASSRAVRLEAGVSVAKQDGVAPGGGGTALATSLAAKAVAAVTDRQSVRAVALALGRSADAASARTVRVETALALSQQRSAVATRLAAQLAQLVALGTNRAATTIGGKAQFATLSLDRQISAVTAVVLQRLGSIALNQSLGLSQSTQISSRAVLTVARQLTASPSAGAIASATAAIVRQAQAAIYASKSTLTDTALGRNAGIALQGSVGITMSLPIQIGHGLQAGAQVRVEVNMPDLAASLATLITAGQLVSLELGLGLAFQVTWQADVQEMVIVIYPTRLLVVQPENRSLSVRAEQRFLTVTK